MMMHSLIVIGQFQIMDSRENDKSGVYALKITSKDKEDYIPFFVTPKKPKAKIAVQMATFTYLAYANLALYFDGSLTQAIYGMTPIISEEDIELYKLSEFGLSTYDHHSDGEECVSLLGKDQFSI